MNTKLTKADVNSAIGALFPTAQFDSLLNRASERLIYSGKWKASIMAVTFNSSTGYITLAPEHLGILASTWFRVPVPVYTQFHQYVSSGPGAMRDTDRFDGILNDMGDGFVSQTDIVEAGGLRVYSSGSDDGSVVRVFGISQETGEPIYDNQGNEGEELTLAAPYVQTINHYSSITGFSKLKTKGALQVKVVPSNGDAVYQIASYQPFETNISYRRYKTGTTDEAIRLLVQRRFIPYSADTNFVYPGSIGALQFAMKAVMNEDTNSEASQNWVKAYEVLNQEAKSSRAGARPDVVPETFSYLSSLPSIN